MTNAQILKLIADIEKRKAQQAKMDTSVLKTMHKAAKVTKSREMMDIYEAARDDSESNLKRMDQMIEELRQKLKR